MGNMAYKRLAGVCIMALLAFGLAGCTGGGGMVPVTESQGNMAQQGSVELKKNAEAVAGSAGGSEDGKTEKDSVIVVMGPNSEPESGFDPAFGWGAGEHVHEPLIQSTLTVTTKDLKIDYDLATDIKVSEDGLTWTVTIRDGVIFSDNSPLTAADVAFTYNMLRDTSSVNDFTMLKEAKALDDTTVEFTLNRPYSIWPYTMAITGVVPEHAYGPDYGSMPVGSGPIGRASCRERV